MTLGYLQQLICHPSEEQTTIASKKERWCTTLEDPTQVLCMEDDRVIRYRGRTPSSAPLGYLKTERLAEKSFVTVAKGDHVSSS